VIVNAPGTLGGTGFIEGHVLIHQGGTLSPGTSSFPLGTLTLAGGLTLDGTILITITPTTSNSISLTGSSVIFGPHSLVMVHPTDPNPGDYTVGTVYPIITDALSVSGMFSSIMAPPGFTISAIYQSHDVLLVFGPPPPPPPPPPGPPSPGRNTHLPISIGPYGSTLNSLFAVIRSYEMHYMMRKAPKKNRNQPIGLLVDAGQETEISQLQKQTYFNPEHSFSKADKHSLWLSLFGELTHQKNEPKIPTVNNEITGFVAGFDYQECQNMVIGGGIAYAFNYASYSENIGHTKINQEFAFIYTSFNKPYFFMNAALWIGRFQLQNLRHRAPSHTSKAHTNGWLLCPHLELSTPFYAKDAWFLVDPFVMFDWGNDWQKDFRERGSASPNISMKNQFISMLRSEVGIRLYEIIQCSWGRVILEEKGSYVNKAPFNSGKRTAFLVGIPTTFGIETFSGTVQNLALAEISLLFLPRKNYPCGSLTYQTEFGSSFQSYFLALEIGQKF
jgi:outer membrane autotransporter protein